MQLPGSIVQVIRAHARRRPDDAAFSFLASGASGFGVTASLSYGGLDAGAGQMASALADHCEPGDRVLLTYPPGPDFLTAFLGCMYAGALPVPAPLPSRGRGQEARVTGIMASSEAALVLTDERNLDAVREWAGDAARALCVPPDARDAGRADAAHGRSAPETDPGSLAFLQYTSGSTSDPRGVMVSHANLVENLALLQRAFAIPDGARVGGWVPQYHDMGLIGILLLPLFLGGQAFLMSPMAFLRRPVLWLKMIDAHGVVFSPAPNFGFDQCVRRVSAEQAATLDLSRWRWALNGSEPVHAATLESFAAHFAAAGFRPEAMCPSYGLAESTLLVSGGAEPSGPVVRRVDGARFERNRFAPAERDAEPRRAVSSGPVGGGYDLRIVDPQTRRVLPADEIGEIWLRGPSVAAGYWRREEDTARTFRAHTADGDGPFLRTGDLGVHHDGRLYVTGRLKEVMILNGRNVYPQDVERAAREQHPACADGMGAAFTVTVEDGVESLVLVQEIRWREPDEAELREIAHGMMTRLSASLDVSVGNIAFVRPGAVLRSTSGKVRRVAMRGRFQDAALAPVFEALDHGVRRAFRGGAAVRPSFD